MSLSKFFLTLKAREFSYGMVSIDIPDTISHQILELGKLIKPSDLSGDGLEKYPHITVKYGLMEKDIKPAIRTIEKVSQFSLITGNTSLFETDDYDVVKIEIPIIPEQLQFLHDNVKISAKDITFYPEYNPHITVGYVKKGKGKEYLGLKIKPEVFDVTIISIQYDQEIIEIPI